MTKLLCASLLLALAAVPAAAQEDEVQKSVVKIFASVSPPNMFRPWEVSPVTEGSGTGVVISGRRILTNAHVVVHAQQIYVQPNKSSDRLNAVVEFLSSDCDLAVLKLEEPEELGEVKELELAEGLPKQKAKISVMGYPTGGDTLSITEGVVSRIEFTSYYYSTAALRIQVDAAVNPGNSGGPGVVDGKIAGIVFGVLSEGENIGYLIPAEVVRHFLEDWGDGRYDGFPKLDLGGATLENPALRSYLKLEKKDTGVVVHRVDQPNLKDLIRPWDVITECEGVPIDNLAMVEIEDGQRVSWSCLIARKPAGSTVKLKVIREGARVDVEVPTLTQRNSVIQRMTGERPTYFVYGGLIFSPVTQEMLQSMGDRLLTYLAFSNKLIAKQMGRLREDPAEEIVATCQRILPHKLTKGYDPSPLSVVTHVNDQPVRNLRHMITLIKENKSDFIVFRFEDDHEEKVVLDPKEVKKHTPELLRNNNIPADCSDDLKDIWP